MAIVKVSRSVEEILEALGLSGVSLQARIAAAWPAVVGPLLVGKTSPARLKGGVLTVHVPNHAWAQELTLAKPALLERIGSVAGKGTVADIRFRVGPVHGDDETRTERDETRPPADTEGAGGRNPVEMRERAADQVPPGLSGVPDPETREILLSLSRRASARMARDPSAPPRRRGGAGK